MTISMDGLPRRLGIAFPVLVAALVAGGVWFYRDQEQHVRAGATAELQSIARLKAGQIAAWRTECANQAGLVADGPFLAAGVAEWLAEPHATDTRKLEDRLRSIRLRLSCRGAALLDRGGRQRLDDRGRAGPVDPALQAAVSAALSQHRPQFTDLRAGTGGSPPHLHVVAPIYAGAGAEPLAAIALRFDATDFLYPLLDSWPLPSRTAETVLVRRDGDSVLFLSELRHQKGVALKLRIPLTRTDVPAVQAALGQRGVTEGVDYRGVPILSVVEQVPGSPWLMIAKVDRAEALAEWRSRSGLLLALMLFGAVAIIAGTGIIWQRDARRHLVARYRAEAAHRASEARYSAMLMSIGDAVTATDSEGRVALMNSVAEALTGWPLDQARGRPLSDVFRILNEDTRQPVEDPVARVLREGVVVGLANHTMLLARDGAEYPIADSGAPIRADDGEITGVVLVFRDQTEERRAELARRESDERARELFEHMSEGLALCRVIYENGEPCDWVYLAVNEAFGRLTGLTDVVGRPVTEVIPGIRETDPELFRIYGRVARGGPPERFETYVQALDMWFSVSVYCFEPEHFVAIFDVVTERKQGEQALRESEERYRVLYESSRDALMTLAPPEWRFTSGNPAAVAMFGARDEAEFTARPPWELSPPEQPDGRRSGDKAREMIDTAMREGSHFFEWTHKRLSGEEFPATVLLTRMELGGEALLQATVRDVTEQQRLAEQARQAQKLEAVGQLAGGLAHDLNNLLTPILANGDLLQQSAELTEDDRESAGEIVQAAGRARDLVRQLLAFGRKQVLHMRPLDVSALVREFATLLRRTIREDIVIETELAEGLPLVRADAGQLEQVLMNLAVNAQDAMPHGGVLHIATAEGEPVPGAGRAVKLTVSDTGSGMDAAVRERAFTPFFTTKGEGRGSGLGLATAYRILQQHGGAISLESEPGRGTTFYLYLPAAGEAAAEPSKVEAVAADSPGEPAGGAETVLVVEDQEMVRSLVVRGLSRLGYTVLAAAGAGECLALMEGYSGTLDLVLTDVVMPGMNGAELYALVAERYPGTKVLFMSGYSDHTVAARGVVEEGAAFIQKPFSIQALGQKVRQVLEGRG
ncbi:MAG: PAS domain S-box protein [Armatimonadetes bacterium]|nr:PAS domain S-box protein [Armatimonadota bacterium]